MRLELTVVDAFTDVPFTGNPAAVAVVETFPGDELMQAVATEMNHPETAFVAWRSDGDYDLRWFTPTTEV
ncbi:MAG TPA: PhzF family phenazine biosynthesis protein, partial [Acidimicrobiales bacterium]|nr:PhzF family phenazine biosynthesis protein [Acidimicrobiales bacterium]